MFRSTAESQAAELPSIFAQGIEAAALESTSVERRCSESDVLQYMLEIESSRDTLQRYACELSQLAEYSAQATRQAQQAAQSKADLLATMSHEIRTPLNGILGMSSLLLMRDLPAVERDYAETIKQSGESLLALVDDVLDFSKIEADRLELESSEFELGRVADEAIRMVKVAADRKGIQLSVELGPEIPAAVQGDALRVRQILLNFLSNAIKFTAAGRVTVRIGASFSPVGEQILRFTVTDTGMGISPEGQARLFQPFSQADSSISRQFGGTGLGLAICKRLAEKMGGAIGVESEVGKGASFWFTMRAISCVPKPVPQCSLAPEPTRAPPQQARILLVEDNPVNQKVALLMLKKLGYTAAMVAVNGARAVEAVAEQQYDLIFMDCLMPEMDGFSATRMIRQSGDYGSVVPIVAMTANAFAQDREACFASGMNDYLAKPVREAELRAMLDKWLVARELVREAVLA